MHPFKDTPSSLKSLLSKDQTKLHSFLQLCNIIFLLMSRNYVSLFNKKYVCMVVIGFPFLLQSSEPYWPFGLVFDNAVSVVSGGNLGCPCHWSGEDRFTKKQTLEIHIVLSWLLFLGPIKTGVRKCIFPKYVSRKITWSPIFIVEKNARTRLCALFQACCAILWFFVIYELIILWPIKVQNLDNNAKLFAPMQCNAMNA